MSAERYMVDDAGTLIDKVTRENYELSYELVDILNHYETLLNELFDENEQLKQRINSRLHFYRELYESTNDKFVERVIEDLEDILKR